MFSRARKTFNGGAVYGVIITLLVAGLHRLGFLDSLENWCYDQRIRYCQFFTPPPTNRLVHLDIDDPAMDSIGAWPWPRSTLAEMVDEIHLVGPKAVAFDVIFQDPAPPRYVPRNDGKYDEIDDDRIFADSLQRLNCALIPLSLPAEAPRPVSPFERALRDALLDDLELTEADVPAQLASRGLDPAELKKSVEHGFINMFLQARHDAMHTRLVAELSRRPLTEDQVRAILLPKTNGSVQSPAVRLLDDQYLQVVSELALQRFTGPVPTGIPPLLHSDVDMSPINIISSAARATGFVDNQKGGTGTVRKLPLFMEHNGRVYPQIGVALAAMTLDADTTACTFTEHQITIPRKGGGPIVIQVNAPWSETFHQPIPTMFDIPWFGPVERWDAMYDKVGGAHLSLNVVWDACQTRHRIRKNNRQADEALLLLYALYAPEKKDPFEKAPLPLDDPSNRLALIKEALSDFAPFLEAAEQTNFSEIKNPAERRDAEKLAAQGPALRYVLAENPRLAAQLTAQRDVLKKRLNDKAILIGWTSTAYTFDEVATPLHTKCPGVVVHGAIFNAIVNGYNWRRVPPWVDTAIIIVMGLLTTAIATQLLPFRAMLAAMLVVALYAPINGLLIFDWSRHIATLAGPIVAVALVWAGCTLARLLIESWERARITRRFQSYVDPALVKYVIDHPELARLEGEVREMTVCFTDLVGFTSLTERLREKAVKILGRYIVRMVPTIRNHRGLVHRFMGDGIMFSYGAPIPNPDMAIDAVTTIMEMNEEMVKFNDELEAEGYPRLAICAGVNTGPAVVGDSGADDAAEYACLGDTTNLAARLEGANRALGTHTLIASRTVELLNGKFLVRPIARLIVKGKHRPVMVFEPLAYAHLATPGQKHLTELTEVMFDHYLACDFADCIAAADRLDEAFGLSKLTTLYREVCTEYLSSRPTDFHGNLSLNEK